MHFLPYQLELAESPKSLKIHFYKNIFTTRPNDILNKLESRVNFAQMICINSTKRYINLDHLPK
jgi:hypothetical protein